MAALTLEQAYNIGIENFRAGRRAEAESIFRQILNQQPRHADSMQMLGLLLHQRGDVAGAITLLRAAAEINPASAGYHANLGLMLASAQQWPAAIESYRRALAIQPNLAEVHNNLGNALRSMGRGAEAIATFESAISINPDLYGARLNFASALNAQGEYERAITAYQSALAIRPDDAATRSQLGSVLHSAGRIDQAIAELERAVQQQPKLDAALNNLGVALKDAGEFSRAIDAFQRALTISPADGDYLANLGNVYLLRGDVDEAADLYRRAIALRPNAAHAHNNLGNALKDLGQIDQAISSYRRAIDCEHNWRMASNLLYSLHLHPGSTPASLFEEHRKWNENYAQALAPQGPVYPNEPDPERRLRIGYVSPDFREHPVGRFIAPLLAHHDHAKFEIYCYAGASKPDPIAQRIEKYSDVWRDMIGMTHDRLERQIREDRIDLLIDLSLHGEGNRMAVFARKPAPVQASYLAYASTSGLSTMDYRLTDPWLDPPGVGDEFYSETSIRLPRTYWCYEADESAPEVAPPPSKGNGFITFGCFNNFCKVSEPALRAWRQILSQIPDSRLILHARGGSARQRVSDFFSQHGIDPSRLSFSGFLLRGQYFRQYGQIDIALDPFPYPGGTTTCDALWMGVPVVSLAGVMAVSRGGLSILSNVGLPELAARSAGQYMQIAMNLASDPARLEDLRTSLRSMMRASPLMDAPQFARDVEAAYRQMWRAWCEHQKK
ncbi:MAG TPA: tetratricopeptide repeat protein [Tepidisphaeraceae bacterium]|nr:tetratricopeptide repeat protein [Tepidisphaeraceae bacterium]